jgi:hypothetical protein
MRKVQRYSNEFKMIENIDFISFRAIADTVSEAFAPTFGAKS